MKAKEPYLPSKVQVQQGLNLIRGTGSRLENETVILWNEAEDNAIVNTASPSVYRKLIKRGFLPRKLYNDHRAMFDIPKSKVRLPSQGRKRKVSKPTQ